MRIAIVGNFGLGSRQTMAVRALPLAEELVRHGHAVQMALPIRWAADEGGPGESGGVALRYAGRGLRIPGLSHLWQLLQLTWFSLRWHPDAVYCFKPVAYSAALLSLFWWLRQLRLYRGIIALDTDDWEGDGGWNERLPLPWWIKSIIARQERWSLRHADLTTVASRSLLELVEGVGGHNPLYLPNALCASSAGFTSPSRDDLREALQLGNRPVVLLYTRFVEFQPGRVLDVFQQILACLDDAVLLVVGRGLAGEEEVLEKEAAIREMGGSILFAGWVPMRELSSYFTAANVALYLLDDTLLNRAKCPMKLLELLAAGVPVVADAVGQACEYISGGRSGLLVEPGDPSAMSEAVTSLLAHPERGKAMGETARADARKRWSWAVWAPVVEEALTAFPATRSGSALPATRTPDPR